MNELNRHKKSDKIKWTFTGIAFLLIFVMFTGLCLQLFGTGKQKPSEWFKKPDTEQTQPETPDNGEDKPAIDENGKELASGIIHAMPARMTFRTAKSLVAAAAQSSAYDSVTVNATVKPVDVNLKSFVFTVEWVNSSSDWATGKTVTDYFTVTPSGVNSKTATLQCLQPFGEQIKVIGTATSLDNKTASAECTVDFVKRVIGWNGMFFDGPPVYVDETTESIFLNTLSVRDGFGLASFEPKYSAYTIDDNIELKAYLGAFNDVLANAEPSVGIKLGNRETPLASSSVPFLSVVANEAMTGLNDNSLQQYVNPFVGWLYENRDTAVFRICISGKSEYQTIEKYIPIKFSANGLVISVEDVEFDKTVVII